jgi:hypothetical protein
MMMFQKTYKKHYGYSSKNITFSLLSKKIGKNATLKTISNALWRFKHGLNMYYVQRGLSPLNRFGYITANEWDIFIQQHTTPDGIGLSKEMKKLNVKNKFRIPLKVGWCTPETRSRVLLIRMIVDY